jgi:WD40 repeat protein
MIQPDEETHDDDFAALLAEYDDALAQGRTPAAAGRAVELTLRARLHEAQACLDLLESAWPRGAATAGKADALPVRLGRFELRRELGRGGFGVVYLAYDPRLRREVALKMPRPEVLVTDELRRRFRLEAKAAARLSHPNLVPIHEVGDAGPVTYLVTEYVPGPALSIWLRQRTTPLPPRDAARLMLPLADAVAYMHGQGVLHRDLKPANILLQGTGVRGQGPEEGVRSQRSGVSTGDASIMTPHPWPLTPKITDFGLAKLAREASVETRTGALLGTPAYIAPEQADRRLGGDGTHSDTYALGVILYELLTGQPPFRGETDADTIRQLLQDEPLPPRSSRREIPRDLETICLKCLEKEPRHRYGDAALLASDLHAFLGGKPIQARPLGVVGRTAKWVRRHRAQAGLGVLAALATVSLFAWAIWYFVQLRHHNSDLTAALSRAELGERRLREENYAIQIKLADALLDNDPSGLLAGLLDGLRGGPGDQDLRGFEWHHLWHGARRTMRLRVHRSSVFTVATSPDGRRCASGDDDGAVCLWEARTGILLRHWTAGSRIRAVRFSPDGKVLATCSRSGRLSVWDIETGAELVRHVASQAHYLVCMAFHPNGETIAFGGSTNDKGRAYLGLWGWRTDEVLTPLDERADRISAVQFSPDGRTLAAALEQAGDILLWPYPLGPAFLELRGHERLGAALVFTPDGKWLLSGGHDGAVKWWDLGHTRLHRSRRISNIPIRGIALAPDGRTLAVVSSKDHEEAAVSLWDTREGTPHLPSLRPTSVVSEILFTPDGQTLALACWDHTVQLWRPFEESPSVTLAVRGKKEAWSVAFAPDSQTLAVGYDDEAGWDRETLKVWDVLTGAERVNLRGHGAMVNEVVFSTPAEVVSAGYDGAVKIWDMATGRPKTTLCGHGKPVRCVAASADGTLLASAGFETSVRVWDAATGQPCYLLEGPQGLVHRLAFAPDSQSLAAADNYGDVHIWDVATRSVTELFRQGTGIMGLAYAPDGSLLATANRDGVVTLYDRRAGGEPRRLLGHRGEARFVTFSPDGKTLASGGEDCTVRLWQVATGRELLVFKDLPAKVNSVAFSPDGRHLAAAIHNGSVRVWHAAIKER